MKRSLILLVLVCLCGWPGQGVAQSSRSGWGSIPYADETGTGVAFRVWAPGATGVSVVGSFNGWNTAANSLALENATSGVWSADVATARTNDNYKYMVNGKLWRSDPRARIINSSDHGKSLDQNNSGESENAVDAPELELANRERRVAVGANAQRMDMGAADGPRAARAAASRGECCRTRSAKPFPVTPQRSGRCSWVVFLTSSITA